jgi:YggT family protein
VILFTLLQIVYYFLSAYGFLLLIRAILSWLQYSGSLDPNNGLVRLIYQLTDPIIEPIRRFMPPTGMFDFSVMVALLLIFVLQQVVRSIMIR